MLLKFTFSKRFGKKLLQISLKLIVIELMYLCDLIIVVFLNPSQQQLINVRINRFTSSILIFKYQEQIIHPITTGYSKMNLLRHIVKLC